MSVKKAAGAGQVKKRASVKSAPSTAAKRTSAAKKAPAKRASAGRTAEAKYTDPALRDRIKEEVTAGDKGGNPGQWSARKAQMVAHEYEAQGGGYKGGKDESQENLTTWGDEHWTTADGEPARRDDGMHRYLPEKAWDKLSPAEKAATDDKKLEGSGEGKQFVANTGAAKRARKQTTKA